MVAVGVNHVQTPDLNFHVARFAIAQNQMLDHIKTDNISNVARIADFYLTFFPFKLIMKAR